MRIHDGDFIRICWQEKLPHHVVIGDLVFVSLARVLIICMVAGPSDGGHVSVVAVQLGVKKGLVPKDTVTYEQDSNHHTAA